MKKMAWEEILKDFLIGGGLIASAITVGILTSPLIGGIIAALPIRAGLTFLLGGLHEGTDFVHKMVEGSMLTYIPTMLFFVILYGVKI